MDRENMYRLPGLTFALCAWCLLFVSSSTLQAQQWYKGALHCHSLWSDGNSFPEKVIDVHRDLGYQFVVISDHSKLQVDKNRWKELSAKDPRVVDYMARYGSWVEQKDENGKHFVRLKTIDELKKKFDVPGEFLLIPGHEQNAHTTKLGPDQFSVHANPINIAETIPWPPKDTPLECIRTWRANTYESAKKHGLNSIWMLNHPIWVYYDVMPRDLIAAPEVQLFEWNSDGLEVHKPHPAMCGQEGFWDIVCAFRIIHGDQAIYCAGGDDAHNFDMKHVGGSKPGCIYTVVRAAKLDANTIVQAMKDGDFYISTGVTLNDVAWDKTNKTLTVRVKAEPGVSYRIEFLGTKRNFDQSTKEHIVKAEADATHFTYHTKMIPNRIITEYSKDIGRVFQTTQGPTATYTLKSDDLYIRARITSDRKATRRGNYTPEYESAWTQPVGWK